MTDRDRFMLIGGLAGAALGAALAWAYYRQQTTGLWVMKREHGQTLTVEAGALDFVRIGASIFAVVRALQAMVKPKK